MPEIVNISEHQTSVAAKPGEPATAGFDVVNVSGRPLDVALRVVPEPSSDGRVPDWIALSGEDQVRLDVAETRKCEVVVAPPDDAVTGEIAFCLKAFEPALPEENTDLSSVVTASVEALPQDPPEPKPWGLIAAIVIGVALLIGGGIGAWMLIGGGTKMPDVAGMTPAEVRQALAATGAPHGPVNESLVATSTEFPAAGVVVSQIPAPGEAFDETTEISLSVTGARMPDVVGLTQNEALGKLNVIGVPATAVSYSRPRRANPGGKITAQAPGPNQLVSLEGPVRLTIPRQLVIDRPIFVPDVLNNAIILPNR